MKTYTTDHKKAYNITTRPIDEHKHSVPIALFSTALEIPVRLCPAH